MPPLDQVNESVLGGLPQALRGLEQLVALNLPQGAAALVRSQSQEASVISNRLAWVSVPQPRSNMSCCSDPRHPPQDAGRRGGAGSSLVRQRSSGPQA